MSDPTWCPAPVAGPEVAAAAAIDRAWEAVASLGSPGWQGAAAQAYRTAQDEDVAMLAALASLLDEVVAAMAAHRAAREALAASFAGAPAMTAPGSIQPWGAGSFQVASMPSMRPAYGLAGAN